MPGGLVLASGALDCTVKLWVVPLGRLILSIEHHDGVASVAWSPDGAAFASGLRDGRVDVRGGRLSTVLGRHEGWVTSVAYAPDGAVLASGAGDQTVKLWDLPGGRVLRTLVGHRGAVLALAYAPDGRVLASGCHQGDVLLWDVHTGQSLCRREFSSWILALRFDPHNPRRLFVAEAGEGGVPRHWDFLIEDPR
jgi:WD40 repeat protein